MCGPAKILPSIQIYCQSLRDKRISHPAIRQHIKPALLAATLAFVAEPAFTPPLTGYDTAIFPVDIARPSLMALLRARAA